MQSHWNPNARNRIGVYLGVEVIKKHKQSKNQLYSGIGCLKTTLSTEYPLTLIKINWIGLVLEWNGMEFEWSPFFLYTRLNRGLVFKLSSLYSSMLL